MPLVVPNNEDGSPGAWLRVGGRRVELQEGRCVVFDDSFQHEAANDSPRPRVVLVLDVWHPDFSDNEVLVTTLLDIESV
jgi:aspartate beta-hydroxylase